MCTFLYTVTAKNLPLESSLFLFINTSQQWSWLLLNRPYAVILAIGSEENSVAFCLKSKSDSYYFSLAIWNSIRPTKEYQNNYASGIHHSVIHVCCGEWQKHNYHYMRSWIVILYIIATKTKFRNAAPDIMIIIHISSIKPNTEKMRWEEAIAQSTLTKYHNDGTKQGNSGTHVGL